MIGNDRFGRHPLRGFGGLRMHAHGFADSPVALCLHPFGIQLLVSVCKSLFSRLERLSNSSYARAMKTMVTIPDDVFEKAERLARRMKKSRSELFSRALAEYVARHAPDPVTETMNQVCAEIGVEPDPFSSPAARRTLERVEC
jgi:hypothetical protein